MPDLDQLPPGPGQCMGPRPGSGLQLVRLDVGSFGSILVRNPTKTTYTLPYATNEPNSTGGIGSAACENYPALSGLYNSRDRNIENIEFTLRPMPISCK